MLNEKERNRFFDKAIKCSNGCWIWTGYTDSFGYGKVKLSRLFKTVQRAHRVSWQQHVSPIPEGLYVLHKCDNPSCVNPDHLFLGTHQDNMADMKNKGRANSRDGRGVKNGMAKLSTEDVGLIASMLGTMTNKEIAEIIGKVSHSMVSAIRRGKAWSHLTGITPNSRKKFESLKK